MKITFKRTPEQIELVKAMANPDKSVAYEAQHSLAELMGPQLATVIQQAPTLSNLFERYEYSGDDNPSLPLDLYTEILDQDFLSIWQSTNGGGLASNEVYQSTQELKFKTIDLETAWSFDKKHAEKSRLDVVAKTFQRMGQEILLNQESWSSKLIMGALAPASTKGISHVMRAKTSGYFLPDDFNTMDVRMKRIWTSWFDGGTPVGTNHGLTDLIVSPEVVGELRRMSYQAINVKNAPNGGTDAILAPDAWRASIWNSAGTPELWGVSFTEINELGVGKRFNTLFDVAAGSTNYTSYDGTSSTGVFDGTQDQILIGLDRSVPSLYQAVNVDSEAGTELVFGVDDQWPARAKKIGWYGNLQEGRAIIDNRALMGIVCRAIF